MTAEFQCLHFNDIALQMQLTNIERISQLGRQSLLMLFSVTNAFHSVTPLQAGPQLHEKLLHFSQTNLVWR